jgi:hypothetical protein
VTALRWFLMLGALGVLVLTAGILLLLLLGQTAANASGVAPDLWPQYLLIGGFGGTISWLLFSSANDLRKKK